MRLILTDAALGDLRSIRKYTLAQWGERQEQIYLDQIWDKFENLMADHNRCRHRDDLFHGCQIAAQGKHVILFRAGKEALEIVRVLHSAMDFKRHF